MNEYSLDDDRHWFNARQYERGDVQIYADIREQGGGKYKVYIIDLSRSGFRMQSVTYIEVDKTVFLTIPGYTPLVGRVAWAADIAACQILHGYAVSQEFNAIADYGKEQSNASAAKRGIWRGRFINPRLWRERHHKPGSAG